MLSRESIKELTIRDTISIIFRQKRVIFLTIFIVIIIASIGMQFQTPVYEASVTMHIKGQGEVAAPTYRGIGAFRIHLTQMTILVSNPVLTRVVKSYDLQHRPLDYEKKFSSKLKHMQIDRKTKKINNELDKLSKEDREKYLFDSAVKSLKSKIRTELIPHTDIFKLYVQDFDPDEAKILANLISRSYLIYDHEQQLAELTIKYGNLHPSVMLLRDSIRRMTRNLNGKQLPTLEAIGTASVKVVEQATSTYVPIGKPKSFLLTVAIFVSIFLGLALAFTFDFLDHSFKSPDDIVKYLNIPFLGSIIKKRRFRDRTYLKDSNNPNSKYAQFYDELATEIYTFILTQNLKSLLIVSATPQNKNEIVIANVGHCLAKNLEHNTLLVDANLRKPSLHKIYNIENNSGIANILSDEESAEVHNIYDNLSVLTAGNSKQNPIKLLKKFDSSKVLKKLYSDEDFKTVIINCSNMKDYKDVAVLSMHVDGVIIVVEQGSERRQVVKSALDAIMQKEVKIIGGVLYNRKFDVPSIIYNRL